MKTAARAETGKHTCGLGADINAVLIKSEHVLGALRSSCYIHGQEQQEGQIIATIITNSQKLNTI